MDIKIRKGGFTDKHPHKYQDTFNKLDRKLQTGSTVSDTLIKEIRDLKS